MQDKIWFRKKKKTDHSNAVTQNYIGQNWTAETAALMPAACSRLVTNITSPVAGSSSWLSKQLLHCCSFKPSLVKHIEHK